MFTYIGVKEKVSFAFGMLHILFIFAPSSRDAQNSGQHKVSPMYFSVTALGAVW